MSINTLHKGDDDDDDDDDNNNIWLKIYSTIILPVVLYGCETW